MSNKGIVVVIAAPGGTGKGTVISKYLNTHKDIKLSISCTSRTRRTDDKEGSYFFKTKEEFEQMIKNDELLEYVEFCGNYYGTPKSFITECIEKNCDVLLELEYIGALNVKKKFPQALLIFILPPSYEELRKRLEIRGSDSPERIAQRLAKSKDEVESAKEFDYLIINDNLDDTINTLYAVINYEKHKDNCSNELLDVAENCKISKNKNYEFINNFLNQIIENK